MRGKDIQIGKEYCIRYGTRARVLETCVERKAWTGTVRRDGVRVMLLNADGGDFRETIFASQEVKKLWSEKESEDRARRLAQEAANEAYQNREDQMEALQARLQSAGIETNAMNCYRYGAGLDTENFSIHIDIQSEQLEKILAMIESPEAQGRLPEVAPKKAATALEQVFG